MIGTFVFIGAVLVVQALLYLVGRVRRGSRLGPRLQSIIASDESYRAAVRVLAPLQLLGGAALVYAGLTRTRSDNGPALVAAIVLSLLGTYLGHRAAVRVGVRRPGRGDAARP